MIEAALFFFSILTLGLLGSVIHLVLLQRRTAQKKHEARHFGGQETERHFENTLNELRRLFQQRTTLSTALIQAVIHKTSHDEYFDRTTEFISFAVDTTERIFSAFTGDRCAVSIKLFVPSEDDPRSAHLKTFFRDTASLQSREERFSHFEPFPPEANTMFDTMITRTPTQHFLVINNLSDYANFRHQHSHWRHFFNAAAVHLIADPDSEGPEGTFGFLCVDNKRGHFDNVITENVLSIISTTIYYCLAASAALSVDTDNTIGTHGDE